MGMQSNEGTVMFSASIALLQERFRELERMKEKREEKLLQMLARAELRSCCSSLANSTNTTPPPPCREQAPKWFFHPELLYPLRDTTTTTTTLFPVVPPPHSDCKTFQLHNHTLAMDLRPNNHATGEADVDTSLHL